MIVEHMDTGGCTNEFEKMGHIVKVTFKDKSFVRGIFFNNAELYGKQLKTQILFMTDDGYIKEIDKSNIKKVVGCSISPDDRIKLKTFYGLQLKKMKHINEVLRLESDLQCLSYGLMPKIK